MSVLSRPMFHDEKAAFAYVESIVWAGGISCPKCGVVGGKVYDLAKTRVGLKKCGECRKQFTVRVGTIFEDSHMEMFKWLQAIHLMCSSKKGISAHQLHRILEVQYKTAWFVAHRIREAMRSGDLAPFGGGGIRLDKLANISGELEKFLRHLAEDSGVTAAPGEWIAREFYNSSVGAVIEYVRLVEPPVFERFNEGVRFFSRFQPSRDHFGGQPRFSEATIRNFVDMGAKLDNDEIVKIGLYGEDESLDPVVWEKIAKRTAVAVEDSALRPLFYLGSVQGRLGTWYKESDYINIRDSVTGSIVKCHYKPGNYDQIYRYYKDRTAVVHVSGRVSSDRLTGQPKEISVESIERYDPLSDQEFEAIFNSVPNMTGDESTEVYIDRIRDNDFT